MANVIAVIGDTGTGKSTSVEKLDPSQTFVINCSNKPLPFKGSSTLYSPEKKNMVYIVTGAEITAMLGVLEKQPHIKNIIIDDSGFVMTELFFLKASETGYGKFTEIAKAYQSILTNAKNMRADLNIAFMLHEEDKVSNAVTVKRTAKTVGKLVDDQYNPLSVVSIALFTSVTYDKEQNAEYNFITNRAMINGVEIPAKSPRGMFDTLKIPNDLNLVFTKAREYYQAS
jgi:hypothetical protein